MNGGFLHQYWRVGGVCGILFLLCFIVSIILQSAEPPMHDDSVEEIRAFWVENGNDYLLGDYLIGLGFVLFFLPFISALRSLLGEAEGGPQTWSRIVFGGGVLFFALAGAASVFWTILAWGDVAQNASDETIQLLMWADVAGQHFAVAGIPVFAFPAAFVMVRTKVLPVWLGGLTLILGVVVLLSMLAILSDDPDENFGWIGFPAIGIWVLATSIVMIMRKSGSPAPSAVGTAPATALP